MRVQLDRELESEAERREGAVALVAQLDAAKSAKQGACDREQQLLVQLQDVAQRTEEPAVSASLAAAIETKAGLVAIELLLVDDIEECLAQVVVEQDEIAKRIAAMTRVRASLPASDDVDALRLYTWSEHTAVSQRTRLEDSTRGLCDRVGGDESRMRTIERVSKKEKKADVDPSRVRVGNSPVSKSGTGNVP